ncbi:TPA: SAM-dependent DNA methyltransferase, partial [Streptococcus equi subsp. zooepidemicus]|nr:SAM-dependent DNA methyltransferase [Streptococcus equi subsp. zooepidemicus]
MSKSEQMIQNEIYSNNTTILDKYECISLGATTINNLMKSSIIKEYSVNKQVGIKKPDVLIIDSEKNVIIYVEQKRPSKLKSEKDINDAIKQELFVAKAINAKIYVVSDGSSYIWINPKTGNPIVDENGNRINFEIKPKENGKEVAKLINDILLSINDKSDQILKKEFLDPTDLAVKINRKLVNLTF